MGAGAEEGPEYRDLEGGGGLIRMRRVAARVLLAELAGAVGLRHVQALTQFVDEWPAEREGKVHLFQDLTQVASFDMAAQLHFSDWARARSDHILKLHFAINAGSAVIPTLRTVVMAVPIRAYMYTDRKALETAMQRLAGYSLANDV